MKQTIFQRVAQQAAETIAAIEPQLAALEAAHAEQIEGMAAYRLAQAEAAAIAKQNNLPSPRMHPAGPAHLRLPADVRDQRLALQRALEVARADLAIYAA